MSKADPFRPAPEALARQAEQRGERDCNLAVECMKLAVELHKVSLAGQVGEEGGPVVDNRALTDTAEWIWQWVNSDSEASTIWPDPTKRQTQ